MKSAIIAWLTDLPEDYFKDNSDDKINKVGLLRCLAHLSETPNELIYYAKETGLEEYLSQIISNPEDYLAKYAYSDDFEDSLRSTRICIAVEFGFTHYENNDDDPDRWSEKDYENGPTLVVERYDIKRLQEIIDQGDLFSSYVDDSYTDERINDLFTQGCS